MIKIIKYLFPFLLFICLILASCSIQTKLEPPEPTFTVDGKKVSYERGTYSWSNGNRAVNVDSPVPSDLVKNIDNNKISSNAELEITFDYDPSKMEGEVWEDNGNHLVPITNNTIKLPNEPNRYIYVIHASWEEGDATYAIPFAI